MRTVRTAGPWIPLVCSIAALCGCASAPSPGHASSARHKPALSPHDEVVAAEHAFARTMADRDFKTFMSFLSNEAIFFDGSTVEHGPQQIAAVWQPYFVGPTAPFNWVPDNVQVLPSGQLALSTGPVYVHGKEVARFNSIWRREGPHKWRIVFDKGEAVCAAHP